MMAASTSRQTEARSTQAINLRVPSHKRELIDRAAKATGKTRTDFILDAAMRASEEALLDRRVFQLDEASWQEFMNALDAPARAPDELRRLLAEPAPWER